MDPYARSLLAGKRLLHLLKNTFPAFYKLTGLGKKRGGDPQNQRIQQKAQVIQ